MTLAVNYVEAIATGNVNIESAYDYMIQTVNTKALNDAKEKYQSHMESLKLPVTLESLNQENMKAQNAATDIFLKTAVNNDRNRQFFEELNILFEKLFHKHSMKNNQVSEEFCAQILSNLYKETGDKIENGVFACPGGYALFQMTAILKTDEALSKEQKKQEQLAAEVKEKERMKQFLETQNMELKKLQKEKEETYENNIRKQKEEFARQHQKDMDNLKSNLTLAMEEKERLMKEGFKEHSDLMKEELREAKEEIELKERRQKEMELKMKNEMYEKIKKMREE